MYFNSETTEEAKILDKYKQNSIRKRLEVGFICGCSIPIFHIIHDIFFNGLHTNYALRAVLLGMSLYYYYFMKIMQKKPNSYVMTIAFMLTEFGNLTMGVMGILFYRECLVFYSQTSALLFVYFESFLILSIKTLVIMAVKQTIIWAFFSYWTSGFNFSDPAPYVTGIASVFMLYFFIAYFDYVKDIKLCKSKIKNRNMHKNILSVVEAISDCVMVLDENFNIIFANTCGKSILNNKSPHDFFTNSEYYRKYFNTIICNINIYSDLHILYNSNLDTEMNFGILHHNDELFEWKGKVIKWNEKLSIILCGRNVTHVVKMEKESNESQYKSAILRTVTHELRTPASAVISIVQLIETSQQLSLDNIERLDIIKNSCYYQLCLINDLLDYAQVISGCLKISNIYFNIQQMLMDCIKIIKIQLHEPTVMLNLITKNLPDLIYSDPHRIKQIILNLLSNARKFTIKGTILLEISYEKSWLIIKCIDTGIGIQKDKFEMLFVPFGKIECSKDINPQGIGLGLVISDMLAKELGGEGIKVESEVNKGSCFSFSIPVTGGSNPDDSDIAEENSRVNIPSIYTKSMLFKDEVLVVDDICFNAEAMTQMLRSQGIKTSYVLNGEDAINQLKDKKYSCVLMDCEMPIMDGWETTRKIRQLYEKKYIKYLPPIIACTAHTSEVIILKCKEAGMDDAIIKPCLIEVLISKIRYWINKKEFD
ncbi:hypothetical protein SteCoe_7084 [Stentor coeruleus]|uniref:Histidine kinase n=1 Tax=Stentor coeruleus TaxID=5963 RepID=A0A1R2CNA0_9CILI|nr:hypothetical protein SteCoe_7084 [Stentor coeruleus]